MLDDAALALEEIEPKDKTRTEVLGARVVLYIAAKKWDMAAAVASHLVKVEPENEAWWINLAYSPGPFCKAFQQKERDTSEQSLTVVETYDIIPVFTRWVIWSKMHAGEAPFWYAVYRCADGIERRKSTKCTGKVAAREILRGLEAAEALGASGNAVEEQFRRWSAKPLPGPPAAALPIPRSAGTLPRGWRAKPERSRTVPTSATRRLPVRSKRG